MNKNILLAIFISLFLFTGNRLQAKKEIRGIYYGIELPYSYHFGFYAKQSSRLAIMGNAKIFAPPFNHAYTMVMQMWGANEKAINVLKEPFRFGYGFEGRAHYYFGTDNRRYYVGINAQMILLPKVKISDNIINQAYNVDLSSHDFPEDPVAKLRSTEPLTLKSTYANLGVFFGKRFFYMEPGFELFLEAGVNKTVFSNHRLASDYRYITPVHELNNSTLKEMMLKYGWAPGINISLIKKIK